MNTTYFIEIGKKAEIEEGKLKINKNISMSCASSNSIMIKNTMNFHTRKNAHYQSNFNMQIIECNQDLKVIRIINHK